MTEVDRPAGLSRTEALERLKTYGPNAVSESKKLSGFFDFILRFKNPLILVLLFAATISGYFGDWASAGIIIAIVITSVVLDFVNTYKSSKAAEALRNRVRITAAVVRDGKEQEIPLALIVPGDVVLFTPGDLIPADGVITEARDFFVNESSLTGESFPVEKRIGETVFMGSSAVTGTGCIEVTQTGSSTKFGKIVEALEKKDAPTEFDYNIRDFSYLIMRVIFVLVLFVFFVNTVLKHNVLESFLFSAALAVGLTPELLPMIIAINLSRGSVAMAHKGAIVKRLSAIQNFGSMDMLCTDKTGTLTKDQITLVKYIDGLGKESDDVFLFAYISSTYHTGFKSPLDAAIKDFKTLEIDAYEKVDEIPFDYMRKRESIVVDYQDKRILISKGAPEEIIKICKTYGTASKALRGDLVGKITDQYQMLSQDGFRVLGVSIKELSEKKDVYSKDDEQDMSFIGFIAFIDPPKESVAETLAQLERAGIEIKILTGDNELVAQKIARDIHLPSKGVLLGSDVAKMDDATLRIKVEETTIFARVTPDQKTHIIQTLRHNKHVVGYMGDGINDAPSLTAADVGISVNNAVDVAKESADIILLKKSLKDLVDGVMEGRKTFANTLKYLMMALSSNFGNMFSMAGASLFLPFLPMASTQILLNNLLYDVSQFTIPVDRVDISDIQKPRRLNISFIKKFMLVFGAVSSIFDFITFFVLFVGFRLVAHGFQTGWFIESLSTQALVIYIIRTRRLPFIESRPSVWVLGSTVGVILVGWYIAMSQLGYVFQFVSLSPLVLGCIMGIVISYLLVVELVKRQFYARVAGWQ